jgi:ParB family transcriptional regulator, chromosome partitioning protein
VNMQEIINVPIAAILVANPRNRNRAKWLEIVASIRAVGLKRPITVSRRRKATSDGKQFDLVCGQGRIQALLELGETKIPAIVKEVSREDQFLMSLVENLARRQPSNRAILREVKVLRERGYGPELIAKKLGVDRTFIYGLVHLIECGEESLVEHVESGRLPISVAVEIARGDDHAVSAALSEAYQSGQLRGAKLTVVRKLVAARASKQGPKSKGHEEGIRLTPRGLVREYEKTVRDQRALVAKAEKAKSRMLILASAFRQLLADENFVNLLLAENLANMPEKLAERLK